MAFPASRQTLHRGLEEASSIAIRVKVDTQSLRNDSASGPTDRQRYIALQATLSRALARWQAIASLSGMGAYAQQQYGDSNLNVAIEFTAMVTAATNLRDWIFANFPRDVTSQAVLVETVDQSGSETSLTFSSAQTAGFRTLADVLISSIG